MHGDAQDGDRSLFSENSRPAMPTRLAPASWTLPNKARILRIAGVVFATLAAARAVVLFREPQWTSLTENPFLWLGVAMIAFGTATARQSVERLCFEPAADALRVMREQNQRVLGHGAD